jgi:hypothetical protein
LLPGVVQGVCAESAKSPREDEKRRKTPRANARQIACSEACFLGSPRWSKPPDPVWQSRGQGFKSPQLYICDQGLCRVGVGVDAYLWMIG